MGSDSNQQSADSRGEVKGVGMKKKSYRLIVIAKGILVL